MKITERYVDEKMTVEQYHALGLPHLSHSMIRLCASQGSWVFYHTYVTKELEQEEESDACRLGTLFHKAAEVGGDWEKGIYVVPSVLADDPMLAQVAAANKGKKLTVPVTAGTELNLRSPAHREYIALHKAAASQQGRLWCTGDEAELIRRQVDAVFENPAAREIVERQDVIRERAHFAKTNTPIVLKALLDIRLPSTRGIGGLGCDFKTTRFNTAHAIIRDALNKGYLYQCAHYTYVSACDEFLFIVVTKTMKPECFVFEPLKVDLDAAFTENQKMYDAFDMAMRMESWHSPMFGCRCPMEKDLCPI